MTDWPLFDGAVIFIDAVSGITAMVVSTLFKILRKKIKPILIIDKIEELINFKSLQEIKSHIQAIIIDYKVLLSHFQRYELDDESINKGSIAICSSQNNILFYLPNLSEYLPSDDIIDVAYKFLTYLKAQKYHQLQLFLNKLFKKESTQSEQSHISRSTFRNLEHLEIKTTLLEMIVHQSPSPAISSRRIEQIVKESSEMINIIQKHDPQGPLIVYVSRFIRQKTNSQLLAVARILSGTICKGKTIKIISSLNNIKSLQIQKVYVKVRTYHNTFWQIKEAPCGNIVFLQNIQRFTPSCSLLVDDYTGFWKSVKNVHNKQIKTVRIKVQPEIPEKLGKFLQNIQRLQKIQPNITIKLQETGEHYLQGNHQQVEDAMTTLRQISEYPSLIKEGPYLMIYKEVPTASADAVLMVKSQNKHNRIYAEAKPIQINLIEAIEKGEIFAQQNIIERANFLRDNYGWDKNEACKIWCFGHENEKCNLLIDKSIGVQYGNQLMGSAVSSFHYFTDSGILCGEGVLGMKVQIIDWILMVDAIHRGGGQLIPTFRKLYNALQLKCDPTIYEPFATVQTFISTQYEQSFIAEVHKMNGQVFGINQVEKNILRMDSSISLRHYSEFANKMQKQASNYFHSSVVSESWRPFCSSVNQSAVDAVMERRKQKGLPPFIPSFTAFIDTL